MSGAGVKKTVLLVFDNLDLSGAEKVAVNLLRHAQLMPHVALAGAVCMDDHIGCAAVSPLLRHLTPSMANRGGFAFRVSKAALAVWRLRRLARTAEIMIPVTPPAALLAKGAALFTACQVVPWVHYDLEGIEREQPMRGRIFRDWLQKLLYARVVPRFARIIFVSEASRASFTRRAGRCPSGWVVLPNVLDVAPFRADMESSTLLALQALRRQDVPVLLFLGRIFRQKRWQDAVAAAEILAARGFAFALVFIGDGLEREALLARIASSPAAAHLHYLGPDNNSAPALRQASALVLTSLYEAWPTVILEAFMAGLPVVAYDCPSGPGEMLGGGRRGIVAGETPQDFAQGVLDYFALPETTRAEMAAAAKGFATAFLPQNAIPTWAAYLIP